MSNMTISPAIGVQRPDALPGRARLQHSAIEVRAECMVCGSHAYVVPGVPQSGKCGNCGSLELRELSTG